MIDILEWTIPLFPKLNRPVLSDAPSSRSHPNPFMHTIVQFECRTDTINKFSPVCDSVTVPFGVLHDRPEHLTLDLIIPESFNIQFRILELVLWQNNLLHWPIFCPRVPSLVWETTKYNTWTDTISEDTRAREVPSHTMLYSYSEYLQTAQPSGVYVISSTFQCGFYIYAGTLLCVVFVKDQWVKWETCAWPQTPQCHLEVWLHTFSWFRVWTKQPDPYHGCGAHP